MKTEELPRRWSKDKERLDYIKQELSIIEKDMDEVSAQLLMLMENKDR